MHVHGSICEVMTVLCCFSRELFGVCVQKHTGPSYKQPNSCHTGIQGWKVSHNKTGQASQLLCNYMS